MSADCPRCRARSLRRLGWDATIVGALLLLCNSMLLASPASDRAQLINADLQPRPAAIETKRYSLRATLRRDTPIARQAAAGLMLKSSVIASAGTCLFSNQIFVNGFEPVP